jgi:hypothetical protein
MDETEITNSQYKQFVYWVRDSIIRERMADPAYAGDDFYIITEDIYGDPVTPHLNWSIPIPWTRNTEEEEATINSLYKTHPITGEKMLDASQMNFRYEQRVSIVAILIIATQISQSQKIQPILLRMAR